MRFALALLLVTAVAHAAPRAELGIGGGALWGHDDIAITRTQSLAFQGAFDLADTLDVVIGFDGYTGNYSPEPTNEQSVINVVGGLRWHPNGVAPRDDVEPKAIYVHAMVGVSLLTLIPYDSFFETNDPDAAGLVGGLALGYMPVRVGNVAFGLEARGNAILYNADAGFRQALSLYLIVQIHLDD